MDPNDDANRNRDPSLVADFTPSKHAQRLGDELVSASAIQREVLEEAVESGTESGRSLCGSKEKVKEPSDRQYESVVLKGCPINRRALMHGGGGHDLASPEHSLLDIANVLYGAGDASLVTGANMSDLFLAPSDGEKEDAQAIFENALGVRVERVGDVEQALRAGHIQNPPEARMRIRRELGSLFKRVSTPHPSVMGTTTASMPSVDVDVALNALTKTRTRSLNTMDGLSGVFSTFFSFDLDEVDINLAQLVVSQFADALVLLGFLYILGGRPSTVVQQKAM